MKLLMEQWRKYLSEDGTTDSGRRNGHYSRDTRSEICFDGYANSTDPESGTQGRLAEEDEEEELSELDKISEIFVNNGAQAVEFGEMLLPDSPEVKNMRKVVDSTRSFLKLFENPELIYKARQEQRDPWNFKVKDLLEIAVSDKIKRRRLITMMFGLGQAYINLEGIIGFGQLHQWVSKIEEVAEWAGIPVPNIPEEWPDE